MTKDITIKVEGLSKQYRIGELGTGTLSHDLNRWWHKVRGKPDPYSLVGEVNDRSVASESDYVMALSDINFEVEQGEVLGIIGKNGAGKSTLLKILSKVTGPTYGNISMKGRVASLLEVGTGFHAELTGRENIYLNGAILGMTRTEVKKKLDEIVDFAGIARYVDTPVKRYSSGMTVRLGFAVAAHLEPEILIVDEVLAVGDAEFQKKAIGKMKDVSKGGGRTVLFVSHNMASVKSLCTRAILLENGMMAQEGSTDAVINNYLSGGQFLAGARKSFESHGANDAYHLMEVSVNGAGKEHGEAINETDEIQLKTVIKLNSPEKFYHITYHIANEDGIPLFSFSNLQTEGAGLSVGVNELICSFPKGFFQSGTYYLSFLLIEDKRIRVYKEQDIISFTVVDRMREIGTYMGREPGSIRPVFHWDNKISRK